LCTSAAGRIWAHEHRNQRGERIVKVALFGATGKTERHLIEEALVRGHEVTVFARTGSAFVDPRVRTIHGDLTDEKDLTRAVRGS
jgi:putative NADH-flavin reductase